MGRWKKYLRDVRNYYRCLMVRPLDEKGKCQYKTEKEYLCVKDSEERGFTVAEFKQAQADGWEKLYKAGKKKGYMGLRSMRVWLSEPWRICVKICFCSAIS